MVFNYMALRAMCKYSTLLTPSPSRESPTLWQPYWYRSSVTKSLTFPMRMLPSEYGAGAGLISVEPPSLSQGGVTVELVITDGWVVGAIWGLLKVFLPKACVQRSLSRWSLAQLFEATAELGLWQRVNLTNMKECDVWCDCHVWPWPWSWLASCTGLDVLLSSRLSRTSLDLDLDLGELIVIITGKAEAFIYKSPSYNNVRWCNMLGGKLSQLNDKAQEQEVQKRKQWWINESARQW